MYMYMYMHGCRISEQIQRSLYVYKCTTCSTISCRWLTIFLHSFFTFTSLRSPLFFLASSLYFCRSSSGKDLHKILDSLFDEAKLWLVDPEENDCWSLHVHVVMHKCMYICMQRWLFFNTRTETFWITAALHLQKKSWGTCPPPPSVMFSDTKLLAANHICLTCTRYDGIFSHSIPIPNKNIVNCSKLLLHYV